MKRTFIRELAQRIEQEVTIQGWVHTIRDQKSIAFVIIRDNTGMVQVTINKPSQAANVIPSLTRESTITISGRVVANSVVKLGGIEIIPTALRVEGAADANLPLDPQAKMQSMPNVDVRMDWRLLDLRRPENLLTFQVQTTALMAMREFWKRENFIELQSPKLMGSASESGAELFTLAYFGRPAYLAQSPQFYKQIAMAAGFERVFEIGPAFRADPSFTPPRRATRRNLRAWMSSCRGLIRITT